MEEKTLSANVVNWFPGHMTKAIRQIEDQLAGVDLIIECRDARIPQSSANPVIGHFCDYKPSLCILTKKDLANPGLTQAWIDHLKEKRPVLAVNAFKDRVLNRVEKAVMEVMKEKHDRDRKRGIRPRMVRAMIMGVPNVGKSTLINQMASKRVASVENRPGVTMALKRIKVSDRLELIDTPGLLWPKFENPEQGLNLALCLSVKETGYDMETVALYAYRRLQELALDRFLAFYHLDQAPDFTDFLSQLERDRGQVNEGARLFIGDVVSHAFGRITWDKL